VTGSNYYPDAIGLGFEEIYFFNTVYYGEKCAFGEGKQENTKPEQSPLYLISLKNKENNSLNF